jgi:ATP-dependent RNA helicase DeaD
VVGTPGRLRDHLERGALRTDRLKAVVLDEADEMLDLGFREDLEFILEATPQERRTLLFSATLPKEIVNMAKRYQRDAWRIALSAGPQGHADIEYRVIRIAPNEIEHAVVNLLRFCEAPTTMVFCNTRESVRHLQAILLERGFGVVALSGELSQNERNHALQALRDGRARVCVATDVAARGIDLPSLDLVIHAELPRNAEVMQHRSGRTGRAGRKGVSVLLVQLSRKRKAELLLQSAGIKVEWSGAPSAEDIRKLDQERLLHHPALTEEIGDEEKTLAAALLAERSPEVIAAALVRLYRSQLPAAEEVFDPGPGIPSREPRNGRERSESRDRNEPREPRPRRDLADNGFESFVLFKMNVGRLKNADPRWLIPMICRQGKITKQEIGAIRISERDTTFEINGAVAERFAASLRQIEKPEVRIEQLAEGSKHTEHQPMRTQPTERPAAERIYVKPNQDGPAPRRQERPKSDFPKSFYPKSEQSQSERPLSDRPRSERPRSDKPKFEGAPSDRPKFDRTKSEGPKFGKPKPHSPFSSDARKGKPDGRPKKRQP